VRTHTTGHTPSFPDSRFRTVATIDLSALAHNLHEVRRHLTPGCEVLAVVKADAYGHGAIPVARSLVGLGVRRFGVATIEEGIALREAGIESSILVMGALLPDQCGEAIAHRLTPIIHDDRVARSFADALGTEHGPYPVHLKVDTGMGRLGFLPEDVLDVLGSAPFQGKLRVEGLMTHLADADNADATYTTIQLEQFHSLVGQVKAAGTHVPLAHVANSAAILFHPSSHFSMVRPGIMLYGYHTASPHDTTPDLRPVLSLRTRVVHVRTLAPGQSVSYSRSFTATRPTTVAVLPIGYGDGYNRLLSNRGAVLIKGRRAPIVGRICMDMTIVEVTHIPDVAAGEEAVLIGQQGALRITAGHLASWSQTIPYEILCAIGRRVPRIYR
jgi:alanine racemase